MKYVSAILLVLISSNANAFSEEELNAKCDHASGIVDQLDDLVHEFVNKEIAIDEFNEETTKLDDIKADISDLDKACTADHELQICAKAKGVLTSYNADIVEAQAELDRQKQANSPEGIIESACMSVQNYQNAKAFKAQEHRIGRESGVVSMTNLREAGVAIIQAESEIAQLAAKYKRKTGKALNLKGKCGQH